LFFGLNSENKYKGKIIKLVISVFLLCLHVSLFAQPTTLLQEDFETGALNPAWSINNTGDNGWVIGTDTALNGNYSAYISNIASEGLYTYNPNAPSTGLLLAPITIPAGQPILKVSLTWKGKGEPSWDDLRIKLQAIELVEPAKVARLSPSFITYKWLSGSEKPNKTTIYFNTGISDSTVNLVFEWRNDDCCWFGETETQAPQPAMIDDILVESFEIVPMSGTYTVGAEGDFPTLDDAFSALYAFKASSDVTLELLDNVYDGPVRIYGSFQNGETETWVTVMPAFEVNPVFKFTSHYFYQGEPGDYPSVIIIENTDHINFGGISVDYILGAPGGIQILNSDLISISECTFYGQEAVYTNKYVYSSGIRIGDSNGYFDGGMGGGGGEVLTFSGKPNLNSELRPYLPRLEATSASLYYNNLSITMNEFHGGNFGIYAAGNPVILPPEVATGNQSGLEYSLAGQSPEMSYLNTSVNLFLGQVMGGIHVEKYENLQMNYNVVFSGFMEASSGTFGVSLGNSNGIILPVRINPVQNKSGTIQGLSSNAGESKLGSFLPKYQGLVEKIKSNPKAFLKQLKVLAEKSSGLRKIQEGNSNQMINNILLNISTGSNGLGANIWLKSVSNLDIFHNSMAFMSEDTTRAALLIEGETFSSSIKNNLFYGGPNPLFKSVYPLPDMDYNVFFNDSTIIGIVGDSALVSMEDIQSYTATNLNSHFFDPMLTGEDLSPDPSLYGNPNMIGTPLGVESDYWGNPRNAEFPTIGAHELAETVPVELFSFSGVNRSGQILLFWETKTETNNYGWEIQMSVAGTSTPLSDRNAEWETIGFVAGKGTTTESHSYSFSSPVPSPLSPAVYRLKQIDLDGKYTYSQIVEVSSEPLVFSVEQNYPNPFNPSTSIRFTLPVKSDVTLKVYNLAGQEVLKAFSGKLEAGVHSLPVDGSGLSSGLYVYRISANGKNLNGKMMLLK